MVIDFKEAEKLIMRLRRQGASKVVVSESGIETTWLDPYVPAPRKPRKKPGKVENMNLPPDESTVSEGPDSEIERIHKQMEDILG